MHIGRAGRAGVIAFFVVGALASPAVAAPGGTDPNFGVHGTVLSGWPASTAVAFDVLQVPGGKIVTFGSTGDTGEQIDLTRYNANGSVDSTFGVGGHAVDSITPGTATESPATLLRQPDGKLIGVAGVSSTSAAIGLIRFSATGTLDTTFGTGGRAVFDVGGGFTVGGAALQSDGSIVVAGAATTTDMQGDVHHVAIARFTSAGVPDLTFGTGEHDAVAIAPIANGSVGTSVAQVGSTLVVAGSALKGGDIDFTLTRFDTTGAVDPTFGTSGNVVTDLGTAEDWAQDLVVQPDGKLVVAGYGFSQSQNRGAMELARYSADGVLDASFGTNGTVRVDDGADNFVTSVALQGDGKIVVSGTRNGDFLVARFLTNGARDVAFGCMGLTTTDFGGDTDTAYAVVVQSDGRILGVGVGNRPVDAGLPTETPAQGFALARYESAGNPGACGYVLDGWGGLHGFGTASIPGPPNAQGGPYWPGWDIARDVAASPTAGGLVLDGWGGLHPFAIGDGPTPATLHGASYWPGWDIARGVALLPDGTGGYVLDGWGGLHPFAIGNGPQPPAITGASYWPGWDIARGVALLPDGTGGYVVDGWGGLHPFALGANPAPPALHGATYWPGWDIARGVAIQPDGTGGQVVDGWGGLHPFAIGTGSQPAPATGATYWSGWDIARGLTLVP